MSVEKKNNKLQVAIFAALALLALLGVLHFARQEKVSDQTLAGIVKNASRWGPEFTSWVGQTAPDMTITDIGGTEHSLSDYRGSDVMLVFWGTWCVPCVIEIPHLNDLRKKYSQEDLVILAISNEPDELVKEFAARKKINYTVFSVSDGELPKPFSEVEFLPSSFFIDRDGKIKLATIGSLSKDDMEAIIQAKK